VLYPDAGQAPEGWVQARTPDEAIQLLEAFEVIALSLDAASDPGEVIKWLIERSETEGGDRWLPEQIALHGKPSTAAIGQLNSAIKRHPKLRRSGPAAPSPNS
jgi:hypothetical protein